MDAPLVSIIIDNFNYGRFLEASINSALGQSYGNIEVIVSDDGSTDNSPEIIAGYGNRVIPVLKPNGGHAQAFNAGFLHSRGEVVIFLDSDDALLPSVAEEVVGFFDDPAVTKVHWPLWVIDAEGVRSGERYPKAPLPEGNFQDTLISVGPTTLLSPPTSGNAWSRRFLDRAMPIPQELYRMGAEKYLVELAPFMGTIKKLSEPHSLYRRHGGNSKLQHTIDDFLQRELAFYDNYSSVLVEYCQEQGYDVDLDAWKKVSWWHKQALALEEIAALPNEDGGIIFVDDAIWGLGTLAGRQRIPFLEKDGQYWGYPVDDGQAVAELERLRISGAAYIIFTWHTRWWLDEYPAFREHLQSKFPCDLENERLVVFNLIRSK
jgi:glycosyltransferase involved in cell wall biosynthesis